MPALKNQFSLILEKEARSHETNGQEENLNMLNQEPNIYFSVPAGNSKITRPVTKREKPKQGLLEKWLERGENERFVVENVKINPERADALLRLNTHNRNMKPTVVEQYAHIMRCGEWRNTIEALGVDKNGVLLNGQHRLEAVKKAQITVEFTIWFGIDPEEFKIIDQGSKRGASDLIQINGYTYERTRAPAAKILLIIESGNGSYKPPPQFVSDLVISLGEKLERAAQWGEKLKRGTTQKITTGTAAAVAYYTIQEAGAPRDKLETFFTYLLHGRDDAVVVPQIITDLRDKLMGKGSLSEGHDVASNIKRAAAIIITWNAYRRGAKSVKIKWDSASSLPPAKA